MYSFSYPQSAATTPPIQNDEPPDIDGAMIEQIQVLEEYRLDHEKVKKWMDIAKKDQRVSSKVRGGFKIQPVVPSGCGQLSLFRTIKTAWNWKELPVKRQLGFEG